MQPNAFIGQTLAPRPAELSNALGATLTLWEQLLASLEAELGVDVREWHSYSPKAGWSLRLKRKGRTILYLSPYAGGFRASFALGEKALEAARASKLPARVLAILNEAKRYAEGTAVRIDVRRASCVGVVKKLAQEKIDN